MYKEMKEGGEAEAEAEDGREKRKNGNRGKSAIGEKPKTGKPGIGGGTTFKRRGEIRRNGIVTRGNTYAQTTVPFNLPPTYAPDSNC